MIRSKEESRSKVDIPHSTGRTLYDTVWLLLRRRAKASEFRNEVLDAKTIRVGYAIGTC